MALVQGATNGAALTAAELREILECEKIVQFRDAVLSGTHPRIKIPPHLVGKQMNLIRSRSSPSLSAPRMPAPTQPSRPATGPHYDNSSPHYNSRSPNNQRAATNGLAAKSTKSEINPILLEKSDDLIKAEMQLQRQRLERALREQMEQQRLSTKASLQTSESLPNFDLSEVLSQALAMVQPSTTTEAERSVGARSSASDSFDENTFYSSQHDTPEPSSPSQGQHEPLEVQSGGVVSADDHSAKICSTNNQVGDQDVVMTGASLCKDNHLPGQTYSQTQSLQHQERESSKSSSSLKHMAGGASKLSAQGKGQNTVSKHQSTPSQPNKMGSWLDYHEDDVDDAMQTATDEIRRQASEDQAESPLVRAHNLSPIAPQPARVSPLATARNPPILRDPFPVDEPAPAQVAALRHEPAGISSADSSPKGAKGSDKKKGKKKKRKGKENATTPDSPYIKPEPRSPSPFAVAPLPRPQKRQRSTGQYAAELNYDEPRYEPADEVQERVTERPTERFKQPQIFDRFEARYEPEQRRLEPTYHRLERDDVEYRRVSDGHYARRPQSPGVYALPYAPSEIRPVRTASHAIADRRAREEPLYYREPLPRASVRPDADRERSRSPVMRERRSPIPMGPPRQPVRILVDAFGREYIDPTPAQSIRQSVAPPSRYRDAEVIYERAPLRTVSSRPVEYEDDGIVYRRPSPPLAGSRRVITQQEYVAPDYRSYRQREYSVRPMAPPGEDYIQVRGAPERRQMSHFEEARREYVPRAPSLRPEPVRYEVSREYVSRLQSVRPEPAAREMAPQSQREFSVRPVESIARREQVTGREAERYYDEMPTRRPAEVAFIERPRAREQSVFVYADDARREVRDVYR